MKKIIFIGLLGLLSLTAQAQGNVTCTAADKARVIQWLQEARLLKSKPANWLLYFGRKFVGTPYVAGTLDRAKSEKLVVNLREVDCTTFVEQAAALARCAREGKTDFGSFCQNLAHLRYIGGNIAYTARQHYFTVWIKDNVKEGLVTDLQGPRPPFSALQRVYVNYMTTHRSSYRMLSAHPEWVTGIREMEKRISGKTYRYIPKRLTGNVALMRKVVKDGDILVILTRKKGLDTSHIGIAVWGKDRALHLLNASSIHHRVIEEPMTLYQYMSRHPSQIGIRVCRLR